jgi:hypothetical protein
MKKSDKVMQKKAKGFSGKCKWLSTCYSRQILFSHAGEGRYPAIKTITVQRPKS